MSPKLFTFVVPVIILWTLSAGNTIAQDTGQEPFSLGKELKVFAKKVVRKGQLGVVEAIGNVVIINANDTLYGESATYDLQTGDFIIKGNVRFVSETATLYGSQIEYNTNTKHLLMKNARIVSGNFTLHANEIEKQKEQVYEARQAEYSICQDCPESWSVYGEKIVIEVDEYARISHALVKVKGTSVFYLPYIVFPIKKGRESGILYPNFSVRFSEGMALELPFYWAIDESSDMTVSPTFWAKRGWGGDFEYRKIFAEKSWMQVNTRALEDTIYLPNKFDRSKSGTSFFRYFSDVEGHFQPSHDFSFHLHSTMARDLDIVRDHPMYTEQRIIDLHLPSSISFDWRNDWFHASSVGEWHRNQLFNDPLGFDDHYVQTLPSLRVASRPAVLWNHKGQFLKRMLFSFDGQGDVFKQNRVQENGILRNASRLHLKPEISLSVLETDYFTLKSDITHQQEIYGFRDDTQDSFQKSATTMRNEISFEFDKVFGIAYETQIPQDSLPEDQKSLYTEQKSKALKPLLQTRSADRLTIGQLDDFDQVARQEHYKIEKNSYRHRQKFKVIHHYLLADQERGNQQFREQINSVHGRFDYLDAVRRDVFISGDDFSRVIIPPQNTVELQWNHVLLRKRPKKYNFFQDNKYLRDNFEYTKLAYINVSQGFNMASDSEVAQSSKLTRLHLNGGINKDHWSFHFNEFYFHDSQNHIFNANMTRRFELMDFYLNYQYQDASATPAKTMALGLTLSPIDMVELRYQQDRDFVAGQVVRNIIELDYRPPNKCWIFNVNYRKTVVDSRFTFNIDVAFGGS